MLRNASRWTSNAASDLRGVVSGIPQLVGEEVAAIYFNEDRHRGLLDPLVTFDHLLSKDGAAISRQRSETSSLTLVFEDAVGDFVRDDGIGNNVVLRPGDLCWLDTVEGDPNPPSRAASGGRVHALQVGIRQQTSAAWGFSEPLYVSAADMTTRSGPGYRVRTALGGDDVGMRDEADIRRDLTILDGFVYQGRFVQSLRPQQKAWIYVASGRIEVTASGACSIVSEGFAIAVGPRRYDSKITIAAPRIAHFVLIASVLSGNVSPQAKWVQ